MLKCPLFGTNTHICANYHLRHWWHFAQATRSSVHWRH